MTYFASDPADFETLLDRLTQAMISGGSSRWHVLVDLSFDEGRAAWPITADPLHVYAHGRWSNLRSVSPVLCELPRDPLALARVVRRLNGYAAGRPMLSFLRTALSPQQLAEAKQDVLQVETADGQAFLLRFADTRILETLPRTLTPEHWARVRRHIDDRYIVDRFGSLTLLDAPSPVEPDRGGESARIRLADDELVALLHAGEADALLSALDDGFPELLPQRSRATMHAETSRVCELARRHAIDSSADRLCLMLANRMAGGQLWRDVRLQRWLQEAAWPKDHFADALGDFVETLM